MQSSRSIDGPLHVVMSYVLPLAGVAVVVPRLLQTTLPAWAAWVIGIPAGVSAGWVVSLVLLSLLTILTRRI